MCAQFEQNFVRIENLLELCVIIRPYLPTLTKALRPLVVPKTPASVLVANGPALAVESMQFGLLPRWSKEASVKFATHNARLETIEEKPTFKDAFRKRHCVVPMSGFSEPIYTGNLAGNMVAFEPTQEALFAAGIWEEWVNKGTGEIIQSFSVITSEPLKFVSQTGHDRSPLFLTESDGVEWLRNEQASDEQLKLFLTEHRHSPELTASVHRPLKDGWQKRAPKG